MPTKKVPEVIIKDTAKPLPVTLDAPKKRGPIVKKSEDKTLAPTTTAQDDLVTAGQRRINMLWESTQSLVALSITWAIIYMRLKGIESDGTLTNAFFLIVSMYFIRTNHKIIGGVPANSKYEGR